MQNQQIWATQGNSRQHHAIFKRQRRLRTPGSMKSEIISSNTVKKTVEKFLSPHLLIHQLDRDLASLLSTSFVQMTHPVEQSSQCNLRKAQGLLAGVNRESLIFDTPNSIIKKQSS
ncbi:hypothetical protein EUGRSUZ_B00950 [Eucalyptus grandis]|uniref:Uncharacterized protein n=2 Tax=Eucalyptus grandis TaxID=71139 RepID=A0ACC3LQH4_EUCGR|nr:hypothetical protein EUGRSUZ_B00950 [Eucalyptus grandis]